MSDKKLKQSASENKPGAFYMPRTSPKEGIAQPGRFILEQTLIAKRLGISNNAIRRIVATAGLKFELIDNKRHYDFDEVIGAIRTGKNE